MTKKISSKNNSNVSEIFGFSKKTRQKLPLFVSRVPAGFPSPADDFIEKRLDLNEHLIKKPAATFFVRVEGESMINAGINSGDILIVDRSIEARNGSIIVAIFDGEFTIKRLQKRGKEIYLLAENNNFQPLKISKDNDFEVWGIVTYVIHQVK